LSNIQSDHTTSKNSEKTSNLTTREGWHLSRPLDYQKPLLWTYSLEAIFSWFYSMGFTPICAKSLDI